MKLINEKLWIDLEKYLDMQGFYDIEDQICYAIAQNAKYIEPSYTPHFSLFNKNVEGYLEERNKYRTFVPEFGPNELNWYTKLKGSATLGTQLLVRGNKGYPRTYPLKHLNEHSVNMPCYADFKFLFNWIEQQNCFLEYGRTMFWINEPNQKTAFHTDYGDIQLDKRDMFIWLTGKHPKKLLLMDSKTHQVFETSSKALVFNTINWHGSKGHADYTSWSLRIDGVFNPDWANKVGIKEYYGV